MTASRLAGLRTIAVGLVLLTTRPAGLCRAQSPFAPKVDLYGDPLPPGALARLGKQRFGDQGRIAAIAISPDKKSFLVVLASAKGLLVARGDIAIGRALEHWTLPGKRYEQLLFSPGGEILAVSTESRIYLFDTTTGKALKVLETGPKENVILAFSPDGKILGAAGGGYRDGQPNIVRLWNVGDGTLVRQLIAHETPIVALAFCSGGKELLSGSSSYTIFGQDKQRRVTVTEAVRGSVCRWNVATGKKLSEFRHDFQRLTFSPDGKTCVGVGSDLLWARVVDLATQKQVAEFPGRDCTIAFSRMADFWPSARKVSCRACGS